MRLLLSGVGVQAMLALDGTRVASQDNYACTISVAVGERTEPWPHANTQRLCDLERPRPVRECGVTVSAAG
jgi:hypothetical protein